jgi:hypothetical protein
MGKEFMTIEYVLDFIIDNNGRTDIITIYVISALLE